MPDGIAKPSVSPRTKNSAFPTNQSPLSCSVAKSCEPADETEREKAAMVDDLRKDAEKRDAREDRHWRAGFMDGWNAGVIGDESALKAAGERLDAAICKG